MTPKRIVFASHTGFESPFRIGSHHLSQGLARRGHHVTYMVRPFTPPEWCTRDPTARRRASRLRQGWRTPATGVEEWLPLAWQPARWAARRFARTGKNPLLGGFHRGVVARIGRPDVLLVDEPRFAGLEQILRPRVVVYRATDLMAEMIPWLGPMEDHWVRAADGLVATSRPVLDGLLARRRDVPHALITNGVDAGRFSSPAPEPPEYAHIPRPRAVYVGALDARLDTQAVLQTAHQLPHVHFVLIGPRGRWDPDAANVHLLGTQPYEDTPGFLQHADVGLLPLSDHPANRGRSPMKLYEYLAAGLPVAATRTEELARRGTPQVFLYGPPTSAAGSHRNLADAIDAALAHGDAAAAQRSARGHDWADRVRDLEAWLSSLLTDRKTAS